MPNQDHFNAGVAVVLAEANLKAVPLRPGEDVRPIVAIQVEGDDRKEIAGFPGLRSQRPRGMTQLAAAIVQQSGLAVVGQSDHVRPAVQVDVNGLTLQQRRRLEPLRLEPLIGASVRGGLAGQQQRRLARPDKQQVGAIHASDVQDQPSIPRPGRHLGQGC